MQSISQQKTSWRFSSVSTSSVFSVVDLQCSLLPLCQLFDLLGVSNDCVTLPASSTCHTLFDLIVPSPSQTMSLNGSGSAFGMFLVAMKCRLANKNPHLWQNRTLLSSKNAPVQMDKTESSTQTGQNQADGTPELITFWILGDNAMATKSCESQGAL